MYLCLWGAEERSQVSAVWSLGLPVGKGERVPSVSATVRKHHVSRGKGACGPEKLKKSALIPFLDNFLTLYMVCWFYPKDLGTSKHLPVILEVRLGIATKFGSPVTKSQKCWASHSLEIKKALKIRAQQIQRQMWEWELWVNGFSSISSTNLILNPESMPADTHTYTMVL